MSNSEFQRARTEEQRALRRTTIFQAGCALLDRARCADISLGDIAAEAQVSKSAIIRYFGSREGLLLEIVLQEYTTWMKNIEQSLPEAPGAEEIAAALAVEAFKLPRLCDLLGELGSVLEHNVTVEQVGDFKDAMTTEIDRLCSLLTKHLGTDTEDTYELITTIHAIIEHTWTLANPAPALREAARQNPRIRLLNEAPESFCARQLTRLLGPSAPE